MVRKLLLLLKKALGIIYNLFIYSENLTYKKFLYFFILINICRHLNIYKNKNETIFLKAIIVILNYCNKIIKNIKIFKNKIIKKQKL